MYGHGISKNEREREKSDSVFASSKLNCRPVMAASVVVTLVKWKWVMKTLHHISMLNKADYLLNIVNLPIS